MIKTSLLLLACLVDSLISLGQKTDSNASDLAVTAEVVGYGHGFFGTPISRNTKFSSRIIVYVQMRVENTTDHDRTINMMSCDWPNSWVANGPHGLFTATFQPGCDGNFPASITIPAGAALIFNCPLFLVPGHLANFTKQDDAICFKLGFIDFASTDDVRDLHDEKIPAKLRVARTVYWSNTLTNEINLATAKEVTGDSCYLTYHLDRDDK